MNFSKQICTLKKLTGSFVVQAMQSLGDPDVYVPKYATSKLAITSKKGKIGSLFKFLSQKNLSENCPIGIKI